MRTGKGPVVPGNLFLRLVALLLLGTSVAAAAQQSPVTSQTSPASSQIAYEGQRVSFVDLVANPHMDVEPYRHLLLQHANEPYSSAKVQRTVAALKQTGAFSKVDVQVTPEVSGVRVSFVLEPAYYIGVIEFPGAVKAFTYSRLLQVVNFPDQEAFDRNQLPRAENALLNFFQNNGYFKAKIQSETQLDDKNQLANVIFKITLGKRAKIGAVEIRGADPAETARLLHSMRTLRATLTGSSLKPGKPYTPARIKAAAALMRKFLAGQHRLANKIQQNPPQFHPDTNRADISFNVQVGPVVDIRTAGAKLSAVGFLANRRLKKLIPVYSEGAIDRQLVADGRQNLINYFQSKGFFDVKVNTVFQRQPDKISVLYEIDKGKRHKVERVAFQGNQHVDEDQLTPVLAIKQ